MQAMNLPSGLRAAAATAPLKEKRCSSVRRCLLMISALPSSSTASSRPLLPLTANVRICARPGAAQMRAWVHNGHRARAAPHLLGALERQRGGGVGRQVGLRQTAE